MAVSVLVWDVARARGLEAEFLCSFHFFPRMYALVRGWVGEGGDGATTLSWLPTPTPAHICTVMCDAAVALCPGAS